MITEINKPSLSQYTRVKDFKIIINFVSDTLPVSHQTSRKKSIRILCWIPTGISDLQRQAVYIRDTWAKRCDVTLFMSSQRNSSFPTVGLNVTDGRLHNAAKAKAAWTYVREHHINDADYFLKGQLDTYVVIDNLRRYLMTRNPDEPEYFGHRFYLYGTNVTYVSGGGGIVLSRESLVRLVEACTTMPQNCITDGPGIKLTYA